MHLEAFMRDVAINLRARPEQWDLIDRAAKLLGKNRSDFMLEAAATGRKPSCWIGYLSAWMAKDSGSSPSCSMSRLPRIRVSSASWL